MVRTALIGAVTILCLAAALSSSAQQRNPYEADPAAIQAGRALYASRCAGCHGADAKGTQGPDLTPLWAAGATDARVFESIQRGVDGSIMPPSLAPDSELWAIVAYLRSISTVPPFETGRGDAERGRELFASSCHCCHRVSGTGGALGPDLTGIARIRSREALISAIRDPSASVAPGYRTVALVTKDGQHTRGVAKSEDAFSIQIIAADERLQGYLKAELEALVHESESLMPRFSPDLLSERELDDVLAFLNALRDADRPAASGRAQ
jgi:putative heme-binding domain-containing protein